MADDGMFLNFAVEENFEKSAPKFKGGSWRDRKRLEKTSRQRRDARLSTRTPQYPEGQTPPHQGYSSRDEFSDSRPAKRRREGGDFIPAVRPRENGAQDENGQPHNRKTQSSKPREVISSLFSYNPKPAKTLEQAEEPANNEPSKPSNAPLIDGIDTFTSLGLSPTLAAHLLTKMELKNPTAIQKASISQLMKENSDAFIQSETGSGKTLAYLLPLVQQIMNMSERKNAQVHQNQVDVATLHRDSGLFAIVLAPTRELCKQISVVLERVLGCAHFIVAGTVIGGEKKKSEKARLRKGINILVATPGRLVDHLENTKVLDVSNVRWLVLDEGDRLMDLGFEEDISKIVTMLDSKQRRSAATGLPKRRSTVLCSATMKMNVQKLGEISLKNAVLIKGEAEDVEETSARTTGDGTVFLAPAQLKQSYIVAAAKLRLVSLTALLRRTFARKGSVMKAIVFVSCADSVEFHFKALTRSSPAGSSDDAAAHVESGSGASSSSEPDEATKAPNQSPTETDSIAASPLLSSPPNPLTIYKLHGSLPQASRTAIVKAFSKSVSPSLLIATDVASRGLDLPNLDLVIEYDPPFSSDDHLHRIGRTARLGRDGRAVIFLLPGAEEGYVDVLKRSYKSNLEGTRAVTQMTADDVLRKGFAPLSGIANSESRDWEQKATAFQLDFERWVLDAPANQEMAKRALQSHIRAYATHVVAERQWFDIKELHLGHLAKSFGLRDAPGRMNVVGMGKRGKENKRSGGGGKAEVEKSVDAGEAARKMRVKVRNRKMMMGAGADEFNIA